MAEFDHGTKRIAEAAGRQLARIAGVDCVTWKPLESTLPISVEFLADRVFLATRSNERFVVYFECYTTWDPEAPWDILAKSALLSRREKLPTVCVVVILQSEGYKSQIGQIRLEALGKVTQFVTLREVPLWDEKPEPCHRTRTTLAERRPNDDNTIVTAEEVTGAAHPRHRDREVMTTPRLGVLLSGGGTTLQNLIDRIADGRLDARIVCVVSSRAEVAGVERGTHAGIPTFVVERRGCAGREEFSARVLGHCRDAGADLVCMAGFLQLLHIPADFAGRVLNIHPALLPSFGGKGYHGLHVHEAVLEAGVRVTGCTVHFADNEYDQGAILVQRTCCVAADDTPETLQARVFAQECEAYPEAIRLVASGRVRLEGRLAIVSPERISP